MALHSNILSNGILITNPFQSACTLFEVDPSSEYASEFRNKTLWIATKNKQGAITSCGEIKPSKLMNLKGTNENLHLVLRRDNELPYYSNS